MPKRKSGIVGSLLDQAARHAPPDAQSVRLYSSPIGGEPLLLGEKKIPPRFVAVGFAVMRGSKREALAESHTMAKRIANALNNHKPNQRGE